MADTKISELAAAGALGGTEQVPIVQGGVTKRTTVADIAEQSVAVVHADRSSSDIALNSTTWADVDTTLDRVLTANTGDLIEVSVSMLVQQASDREAFFDAVSVVSASPVNSWGTGGAPTASTEGIQAWRVPTGSPYRNVGGTYTRTLVAGDISAGTVTIRLRYRQTIAGSQGIYCSANRRLHFSAKNFGQ